MPALCVRRKKAQQKMMSGSQNICLDATRTIADGGVQYDRPCSRGLWPHDEQDSTLNILETVTAKPSKE